MLRLASEPNRLQNRVEKEVWARKKSIMGSLNGRFTAIHLLDKGMYTFF